MLTLAIAMALAYLNYRNIAYREGTQMANEARRLQAQRYRAKRKALGLPAIRGKSKKTVTIKTIKDLPKDLQYELVQQVIKLLAKRAEKNEPWPAALEPYRKAP